MASYDANGKGLVENKDQRFFYDGSAVGEEIGVVAPVGFEQDAVDLFEVHAIGLVAHGFEQTGQAKVAGATQEAVGGADNEGEGFLEKGIMGEAEAADLVGVKSGGGTTTEKVTRDLMSSLTPWWRLDNSKDWPIKIG